MSDFVAGDSAIVCAPIKNGSLDHTKFVSFANHWKQWILAIQGKVVRLSDKVEYYNFNKEVGWEVDKIGPYTNVHCWIPLDWLKPASVSNSLQQKAPCNCALSAILSFGCKDPTHE